MIIDGEKFACEACVRGHRVSNCQHTDRPLQHINKKGRPVSQCTHCRQMRKSRSAHIKCDCGEKTSKCTHLQPTVEGHTETCCCNHGGRCTCCHKKEPALDTVPESDSERESQAVLGGRQKPPGRRRRANTIHADGGLTFDQNGHHRPASKHNRAGQKCNPYQLNRVNSTTNATSLAHSAGDGPLFPSEQQRKVKSEAASPLMTSSGFGRLDGLPQLDLSHIDYAPYRSNSSFDLFGSNVDNDGPMYSAGLSAASVDWSHYDLDKTNDGFAPSSYSQAGTQSVNGMFEFGSGSEHLPQLANTTSTSGNVSEVEDFMSGGDPDADSFGGGSFINRDLASSTDLEGFYKATEAANMMDSAVSLVEEDPAFWVPNYKNNGATVLDEANDPLSASAMNSFWEL